MWWLLRGGVVMCVCVGAAESVGHGEVLYWEE